MIKLNATDEDVIPVLAEAVQFVTYTCSRTWEAWQYGTMSEEDFMDAADDEEWLSSTVEVVRDVINPVVTTAEDLNKLPIGSIVRAGSVAHFRIGDNWIDMTSLSNMTDYIRLFESTIEEIRVIHYGTGEVE